MNDETENVDLSRLVKTLATRHTASSELHRSIVAAVAVTAASETPQRSARWWREWPWLKLGTALACGVLIGVLLIPRYFIPDNETQLRGEIVAAHVRSLMATHLEDVASTDQHTVKPWFTGKLDFSPPVNDFSAQGFPLTGGRLEYIDRHLAAALIYHRRGHVINVFVWPARESDRTAAFDKSQDGFNLIAWSSGDFQYWLVSDVNLEELQQFSKLLRGVGS